MKHHRLVASIAAVTTAIGLATVPQLAAFADPTPPVSLTAAATTSSSIALGWALPSGSADPTRFDIQAAAGNTPWVQSSIRPGAVNSSYHYLQTTAAAGSMTYTPTLPHAGAWTVSYSIPNLNSNSLVTSTTLDIVRSGGTSHATVNQRANPGAGWQSLGSFTFDAGSAGSVVVRNVGTGGTIVLADAFSFDDGAGTVITVDDEQKWNEAGGTPGSARAFTVGHLTAGTSYTFRLISTASGVSSTPVEFTAATTPAKNSAARATTVAPVTADNPRNGEGDILEQPNGVLRYVYSRYTPTGDPRTDFDPSTIATRTSSDGGRTWSAETVLFGTVATDDTYIQPALVRVDSNTIGISYTIQEVTSLGDIAYKMFRTSDDNGATWSAESAITPQTSLITGANARLIALASGRLVQVVNLRLPTPQSRSTGIYTSDDQGVTWTNRTSTPLQGPDGFIEATVAEYSPGNLLLLGRTIIGEAGFLWASYSSDSGATWSTPVRTDVAQPNSPAFLDTLPSGGLVLITNGDTATGVRTVLASRVSADGGVTWTNYRQLEYSGTNRVSYPALTFAADGAHLVYYSANASSTSSAQLSLPTNWFTTSAVYPYAPSTVAHQNGSTITFTTVSGGQGTVSVDPRVTVDGVTATTTSGHLTLAAGTHTVSWSAIDSAGREEVWQSRSFTV